MENLPITLNDMKKIQLTARPGKEDMRINKVAWAPYGKSLGVACNGGIYLINTDTCIETLYIDHNNVETIAIAHDNKTIASNSRDGLLCLWDASTGQLVGTLKGHTHDISCINYSPNGEYLASGDEVDTLIVWNTLNGRESLIEKNYHNPESEYGLPGVGNLVFSPDSTMLVCCGNDRWKKVWRYEDGWKPYTSLEWHYDWLYKRHEKAFTEAAFSPDGALLISDQWDQLVVWDIRSGKILRYIPVSPSAPLLSVFEGNILVYAGGHEFIFADIRTGEKIRKIPYELPYCKFYAFSPDGHTVATFANGNLGLVALQ